MPNISEEPSSVTIDQPPPLPSSDNEEDKDETDNVHIQEKLKKILVAVPFLSLLVGGAVLVGEVTIIILILSVPTVVGVADENALTKAQRGVLGGVTILILIEAIAFGVVDIGTNRQRAKLIKTKRNQLIGQFKKFKNRVEDVDSAKSLFSLQQVGEMLQHQLVSIQGIKQRFKSPSTVSDAIKATTTELKLLNAELNNHTLRYMSSVCFDLAAFLGQWTLTLLVIPNSWLAVGVTITGGVVYPLVAFWQKAIHPTP